LRCAFADKRGNWGHGIKDATRRARAVATAVVRLELHVLADSLSNTSNARLRAESIKDWSLTVPDGQPDRNVIDVSATILEDSVAYLVGSGHLRSGPRSQALSVR
jgi:hypothetical protein